jgi:hypothetical protein
MRWILASLVILAIGLFGAVGWVRGYPGRTYSQWMKGTGWNSYYEISNYKPLYLAPVALQEVPAYQEDYAQLWRAFPIRNSQVPLPTRHPLFQTVPIIEIKGKNVQPQIGMAVLASTGRVLSRIFTLPMNLYPDHTQGQELFKLPFIKNRILKKDPEEIWKDVFSLTLDPRPASIDEMIYDVYILHLRSKLLPPQTLRYGLIQEGKLAVIELESVDKDYMVELVMSYQSGSIYSYVLVTEVQNPESRRLRSKFIAEIIPTPMDEAMARLLYTEFKTLNFSRQVDQEGMIYLFSAWSQNTDSPEILKEMIFYLERGRRFDAQLKVLYQYAFNKYGKTFTTNKSFSLDENPEMQLQRKIEIESKEKRIEAEKNKSGLQAPELTPDEKMNIYLKKAKESEVKESDDMTVH